MRYTTYGLDTYSDMLARHGEKCEEDINSFISFLPEGANFHFKTFIRVQIMRQEYEDRLVEFQLRDELSDYNPNVPF